MVPEVAEPAAPLELAPQPARPSVAIPATARIATERTRRFVPKDLCILSPSVEQALLRVCCVASPGTGCAGRAVGEESGRGRQIRPGIPVGTCCQLHRLQPLAPVARNDLSQQTT